jgi:hypothetical protein
MLQPHTTRYNIILKRTCGRNLGRITLVKLNGAASVAPPIGWRPERDYGGIELGCSLPTDLPRQTELGVNSNTI